MANLADIVARVRVRLQDVDGAGYVWPTSVLEEFANEGCRRLAPVCGFYVETDVAPTGATEFTLTTTVGSGFAEIEAVYCDGALPDWYVYAGVLTFETAPASQFTVRSVCYYTAVTQLPGALVDAVVLYACFRALEWLVRRGGNALKRYLVDQGELQTAELQGMAQAYRSDFFELREEWGISVSRGLG